MKAATVWRRAGTTGAVFGGADCAVGVVGRTDGEGFEDPDEALPIAKAAKKPAAAIAAAAAIHLAFNGMRWGIS